jgi:hypothetical protein
MGMKRGWFIFGLLGSAIVIVALVLCYFAFEFSLGDDRGYKDFCGEAQVVQDGFQQFFRIRHVYPAYSMDQLRRMGAIADEIPSEYWVYYTPFSSNTPDDAIVLRMGYGPFCVVPSRCDFSWTKSDLTHDSDLDVSPWKDRLEEAKETRIQQLEREHPSWKIVAAFAYLVGAAPAPDHAELLVGARPNSRTPLGRGIRI